MKLTQVWFTACLQIFFFFYGDSMVSITVFKIDNLGFIYIYIYIYGIEGKKYNHEIKI